MKVTVLQFIDVALGTVPKDLKKKSLKEMEKKKTLRPPKPQHFLDRLVY